MHGIGKEFAVFLYAGLTGIQVSAAYLSLRVIRRIVGHALWALNLEDGIFWTVTAVYLFVQIYHTSAGMIRWYFVLGVVVGIGFMKILISLGEKVYKKICVFTHKK